jgi:hypothetical protein
MKTDTPTLSSSGTSASKVTPQAMTKLCTLRRLTAVRGLLVQPEVRSLLRSWIAHTFDRNTLLCGVDPVSRGLKRPIPSQAFWSEHLARQKKIDREVKYQTSDELLDPTGCVYVYYNTQVIGWLQRNEVEATVRQWNSMFRRPGGHYTLRQVDVYFDPSENRLYVDASEGRLVKAVLELDQHTARPLMSTSMKWLCNRDTGSVYAKLGPELANANATRIFNDGSVLWVSANAIQFSELRTTLNSSLTDQDSSDAFSRKHPYVRRALYMPALLATTRHDAGHFDAQSPFHRQTISNKVVTQGLHLPFRFSGVAPYTMVQPGSHLMAPLSYTNCKLWQQESVHVVSIHTSGVNVEDAVAVTYQGQAKLQTTQTVRAVSRPFVLTHELGLKEAGCIQRKNTVADPEKLARDTLVANQSHLEATSSREPVYALLPPPEVIGVPARLEASLSKSSRVRLQQTQRLDPITRIIPLHSKVLKGEPLAVLTRIAHDDLSNPALSVRSLFLVAQELRHHRTAPSTDIFDSAPALGPEFESEAADSASNAMSAYIMQESSATPLPMREPRSPPSTSYQGSRPQMAQKEREALHRSVDAVIRKIKARRDQLPDGGERKNMDTMLQRLTKQHNEQTLEIRATNQLLYMGDEATVWELRRQYQGGVTYTDIAPVAPELESTELYQTVKRIYSSKRTKYIEMMLHREDIMVAPCSGTVTDIQLITQPDGFLYLHVTIQNDVVTGDGCKIQTCGNGSKGVLVLQADVPQNTLMKTTPSILVDAISTIPGRSTMYLVVECLVSLAVSRYASIRLQTTGNAPGKTPASHHREDDALGLATFVWSAANLECLAYLAESAGKFPFEFGCVVCKRLVDISSQLVDTQTWSLPILVKTYSNMPHDSNLTSLPRSSACAMSSRTYTPSSPKYTPSSPTYTPASPTYMSLSPEQSDAGSRLADDTYGNSDNQCHPDSPVYGASVSPVASVADGMTSLVLPTAMTNRKRKKEIKLKTLTRTVIANTDENAVQRSCRFPVTCFECGRRVDPVLYSKLAESNRRQIMQLENCCLAAYSTFDVLQDRLSRTLSA